MMEQQGEEGEITLSRPHGTRCREYGFLWTPAAAGRGTQQCLLPGLPRWSSAPARVLQLSDPPQSLGAAWSLRRGKGPNL